MRVMIELAMWSIPVLCGIFVTLDNHILLEVLKHIARLLLYDTCRKLSAESVQNRMTGEKRRYTFGMKKKTCPF